MKTNIPIRDAILCHMHDGPITIAIQDQLRQRYGLSRGQIRDAVDAAINSLPDAERRKFRSRCNRYNGLPALPEE